MKYFTFLLPVLFLLSSCEVKTQPLNYGKDACQYCKMSIMDKKFGAEIITVKGKIYKFDSAECMIRFVKNANVVQLNDIESYWVADFSQQGNLINAKDAFYLHSLSLPSPMGGFLTAFSSENELNKIKANNNGDVWSWQQAFEQMK